MKEDIDFNIDTAVDLIMFMGQSNMAGRGTAAEAPAISEQCGREFRAVSDPSKLYRIAEPFGKNENRADGINEPGMKTGSLVSAFAAAYYSFAKIPLIGVSASKGGSSINEWQPDGCLFYDALARYKAALTYLTGSGYEIRRKVMVWCQGETDGDYDMPGDEYKAKLKIMLEALFTNGIENCFIIRIGNNRNLPHKYDVIKKAQTEFCEEFEKAILVSTKFEEMAAKGLMKDTYHYRQAAYNAVGEEAGKNTALFIKKYFS